MNNDWQVVQRVIRDRRTEKRMLDPGVGFRMPDAEKDQFDALIKDSLATAGWAPFHFDRKVGGIAEPWRCYWLGETSCRNLAGKLGELVPDMKPGNKLPNMLAVCGGVALFTWLPASSSERNESTAGKLDAVDREHLAATAAAIQNFLLLCTASGIGTYWGSGTLFESHLFGHLGIGTPDQPEMIAGAIFVHYPVRMPEGTELAGGANRVRRSPDAGWLREIRFG
jgi:nitroreductase